MRTRSTIDPAWCEYDRSVAHCQLLTYGIILLDEYGCPIDDEDRADSAFREVTA